MSSFVLFKKEKNNKYFKYIKINIAARANNLPI